MGALTSNRLDVLGFLKALEICFFDAIGNFLQVSMLPLMSYIASQLTAHKSWNRRNRPIKNAVENSSLLCTGKYFNFSFSIKSTSKVPFVQTNNKIIQIGWVILATKHNASSNWTKKALRILSKEKVQVQSKTNKKSAQRKEQSKIEFTSRSFRWYNFPFSMNSSSNRSVFGSYSAL